MTKKIMVAIDGSAVSDKAFEMAVDLANKYGAGLHLFHVVREMQVPLTPGIMDQYEKLQRQRHEVLSTAGDLALNQAKRVAESKGIASVETDMGTGDPANAIVAYAGQNNIDLIVIGSRGLGKVEGLLLGSVSRKVSNTAKANCLIVK